MMTSQGDTSRMEQSWITSTSTPHYSEDTFTSLSEEEEEDFGQCNKDPFESKSSAEEKTPSATSELTESCHQSPSQNSKDRETENLDSVPYGDSLPLKWIRLLKGGRTAITDRAKPTANPGHALKGIGGVSEKELKALKAFCALKINQLHQKKSVPLKKNTMDQRHRSASQKQPVYDLDCLVPYQLVNRLHLKNIQGMVKQIAETEMHQPSQCLHCMKKRAELAEAEYLRRRKSTVDRVLLQEKLEEYIYTKDSLTLIGEIHKSLPKLSEDPQIIWKELNRRRWRK